MLYQDLRHGLRLAAKNPGFAVVAVLTLALGIGANTSIFSLVSAILLRPLPYPNPEQLVGLGQWRNQQGEGYVQTGVSAPNVADIAKTGIFQQVAYYRWSRFDVTGANRPESIEGIKASADLLPMFGIRPLIGRFLLPEETESGRDQVAVLGYQLWQLRYGSDPAILGKTIDLDQRPYTIIGVMPSSFRFTWDQEMAVFIPLVLTPQERGEAGRGTTRDLQTQGRLQAGISVQQAQAAMDTLANALAAKYPATNKGWGLKVEPLHEAYHRHMQTPLAIMLGAVALVLLIACVNVANLLLVRATARKREIAVRVSIGATRGRLIAQLLTESLLLAVSGGASGLLLAYIGDRLLTLSLSRAHIRFPNASVINIDWRVLLFSLGVTFAAGIIFGLAPAWATANSGLNETLKESGSGTTSEGGRRSLRNGLVVCEMALALMLLTGAGLLVRTFVELSNIDLGINPNNLLTMGLSLPKYKYQQPVQQILFYRELLGSLEGTPGISAAGAQSGGGNVFFQPQGQPPASPGHEPTASFKVISTDFLRAIGTRLLMGREFNERDTAAATPVALISETVARRYWPNANPLGSHLSVLSRVYSGETSTSEQPLEIVGIVKDVRNDDLWKREAAIYVPFEQKPSSSVFLLVRTTGPPVNKAAVVRAAVANIDNELPVNRLQTMDEIVAQTYGAIRFPMVLLWIFSTLAMILSAVGIFGVMSYTVSRRTKELAIRMALGASRGAMLGSVLREGLVVTFIGIAIGLGGALLLSRVMSSYLYGISATDALTFAATSLLLIIVGLTATYIPARRAAKVDPTVALRYE